MAEPQPRHGDSPSPAPDRGDAAGGTQLGEPLKTAAEVVASRLAETVEEARATAQRAGGDVPAPGGGRMMGDVASVIRRYPAASMLIGLGMGLGIGLLVGRRRGQAATAAGA
jgi:ElaB/YqjD/DUF883 family membrane-anchored ribosome-binding protein